MRELGLKPHESMRRRVAYLLPALLVLACKTAPEPSPAEASAPTPPDPASAPAAQPAPTPTPANSPTSEAPPGAPAPAADAPVGSGTRTYAEGTKSIATKVGERFAIALPSNITIPMKWRIEPAPDAKVLVLTDERHFDQPPAGCDGCTGYGGTRLFSFEAKGPGKVSLHFALRPLTNPTGPAQKEVTVEVSSTP